MTVSIINNSWRGRRGRFQADGTREYTGTLDVQTTSADDDAFAIRAALSQSVFAAHPYDPYAFLDSMVCDNKDEHPRFWTVTLNYTTRPRRKCGDQDVDPLLQPAEITWPSYHEEEIVEKATRVDNPNADNEGTEVEDQAILNSAGGPFGDPLLKDVSRKGIIIRRNEADYDPDWALSWEKTVNLSDFTVGGKTVLAKKARIWEITGEPLVDGVGGACRHYWRVTYTIHLKKNGWRRRILDQGLLQKGPPGSGSGERFTIADVSGQPTTEPVPLDGAGRAQTFPYDPVYIVFKTYDERDFGDLNLPENIDGT